MKLWRIYSVEKRTLHFILLLQICVKRKLCYINRINTYIHYINSTTVKRSQKRVTVMVLSVITAFVVSWLPYWVYQGLLIFSDFTLKSLFSFLTILNYANSALNPLLYAFLSQTFRKNLDNLMRCTGEQHPAATNTVALKTLEGTNDEDKQNIKSSVRRLKSEAWVVVTVAVWCVCWHWCHVYSSHKTVMKCEEWVTQRNNLMSCN